mgnify:CR=1 FL=1
MQPTRTGTRQTVPGLQLPGKTPTIGYPSGSWIISHEIVPQTKASDFGCIINLGVLYEYSHDHPISCRPGPYTEMNQVTLTADPEHVYCKPFRTWQCHTRDCDAARVAKGTDKSLALPSAQ